MSVYECLTVEKTRDYSDKEIKKQFIRLGCVEYPKNHKDFGYIKEHGLMQSAEFINVERDMVRIPFFLPQLKKSKTNGVYSVSSCSYKPIPFVVFEWVRRHFPTNTHIFYERETTKLFTGTIANYFKTRKWSNNLFEEERKDIEMRKGLHKFDNKQKIIDDK